MAGSCVPSMDLHSPYNTGNFLTDWGNYQLLQKYCAPNDATVQGSKTQVGNLKRL